MSAPTYLTLRGDVANGINPHKPSEASMGGAEKENDAKYVPNPTTDPSAEEWNQKVGITAAVARVSPWAQIEVRFNAGVPSIFAVWSLNDELVIGDITPVDTGTGIVKLQIPATKLPDPSWGRGFVQETGNFRVTAFRSAAGELTCEIYDADSGAAADKNFVAEWF